MATPEQATPDNAEVKASVPTPIFGSASTFATGTGFGGFTGAAVAAPAADAADGDGDDDGAAPEEECAAEFAPVVQLEEVAVSTGEEDEEPKFSAKAKLYRYDDDEWKERGVGQAKILRHKGTARIRFLFRQDKTLKIRGNHIVIPGTKVQEHAGSEKAMVWSCVDFADEVQRTEMFCIRFASAERAAEFKAAYEAAAAEMEAVLAAAGTPPKASEAGEKAAAAAAEADDLAARVEKSVAVGNGDDKEGDGKKEEEGEAAAAEEK